jgi:hypothetical protein
MQRLQTLSARYLGGDTARKAASALLFLGSLAFVGFFIVREWDALVSFPWQLKWANLIAVMAVHSLASGTLYLPWHLMMRRLAGLEDWRSDFQIYSLSMLSRRIPTPLWYVGSRVYFYRRLGIPASMVLSATGLEAVLIGLSGITCYLLLLPWYTYTPAGIGKGLVAGWVILVSVLMLYPDLLIRMSNWVLNLVRRPLLDARISRGGIAQLSAIYLATWFLDGIGLHIFVRGIMPVAPALPNTIGVSTLSALVALTTLVLPAGLGLKELTMGVLLGSWMPISAGIAISVAYRLLHTLVEAIWALVGQWIGDRDAGTAGQEPSPGK